MVTIKMTDPTPSSCLKCRNYFMGRYDLQEQVQHEVAVHGVPAGRLLLNELLEGEHESHLSAPSPPRKDHP